ncbi:MAG TPA: carboxylating nicotinate-nucleotide diphosphorylase [bacterium]|nr:carboxylating nicotinate-nucleotide diphosphorylase [bacterium]HMY36359.1 carboxylating nicotinate-nucleotide diphosphorylase [bacterium]HMZ05215.1 carboxylating nicotinate-nucleotide diphosphorylase [bacterium]HNH29228.1 carboxylating nicotinate-nucleotide diphosphorylase [bacterium]HNM14281.1 carboxylating nicotinate-nucleotide diphosphorylase [bacterium]
MNQHLTIHPVLRTQIKHAIEEDLGFGDVTTLSTVPAEQIGRGYVRAKSEGVLAGQLVFNEVFRQINPQIKLEWSAKDGDTLVKGQICLHFAGSMRSILIAERTALNFIQRMSGIATLTRHFMERIKHTSAQILDTRKTTPLWRELEKYAVRCGGGSNHRIGLYDMFLIKDNHITASGGIGAAIEKAIEYNRQNNLHLSIEVETKNLDEVREALRYPVQRIMLDNMKIETMREAVAIINKRCETEASGNVSLDTVKDIAETGINFISIGALTHSAPALDLSLLVE